MAIQNTVGKLTRSRHLPRSGTLVLDNAEGTIIEVGHGCVWITLECDPRDIVLLAGMRFEIDRTGRTVIVAETESSLLIHETPPAFARILDNVARRWASAYVRWAERHTRRATSLL